MHLFLFVRGIYHQVKIWETLAQSQFWRWTRTNLTTGKEETTLVQGALRPSVLGCYEYIFPEECLSEVLAVMGIKEDYQSQAFRLKAMRLMFRARKIPKKNMKEALTIPTTIMINNSMRGLASLQVDGVGVYAIGIKKDVRGEMYGYNQEGI